MDQGQVLLIEYYNISCVVMCYPEYNDDLFQDLKITMPYTCTCIDNMHAHTYSKFIFKLVNCSSNLE